MSGTTLDSLTFNYTLKGKLCKYLELFAVLGGSNRFLKIKDIFNKVCMNTL